MILIGHVHLALRWSLLCRPRQRLPVGAIPMPPTTQLELANRRRLQPRLGVPVAAVSQTSLYQPAAPAAVISPPATSTCKRWLPRPQAAVAGRFQVGAFRSPAVAREAATGVHDAIPDLLSTAQIELLPTTPFGGAVVYRARLGNLSSATASAACARLGGGPATLHCCGPGADVVARIAVLWTFIPYVPLGQFDVDNAWRANITGVPEGAFNAYWNIEKHE